MLRQNLGRIPIFIAISAICAMLLSSSFGMQINQGAWAGTFPGENGKIAFVGRFEIYVINADGSNQTRLTNHPPAASDPSWSPDGTKIAFFGENYEIYVMNAADGSGQTRLTNNARLTVDWDPSWSPDGTKIAFTSDRDRNWEIYVMNADGTGQTRLTNNAADESAPSWSPDGTKIAFTRNRDHNFDVNYDIYVMNAADGSGQTRLTMHPDLDRFPNWSPDGTKIAFSSYRDGNEEIYVMNAADGSDPRRLTNNPHPDYFPSWSPDGEKIAFISGRERNPEDVDHRALYVMNANDGSDVTRLTAIDKIYNSPDWGPATEPEPPEDTTSPVLTVPEDITEEATSEQGAEVTYTVTAQDNVDGNATLEEDGTTVTQDDIGGDIDISCEPASGTTFPIGETTVECSATDEAGNTGTASFTVTVNAPSPLTPAQEAIDELISTIQNLDDNVPQDVKTSLIALLNEISNILNDNNPNNDESACDTLDGFINQVSANERSDALTADVADELSTQSEDIRNTLDC